MPTDLLEHIHALCEAGCKVFPCLLNKHPATTHGHKDAEARRFTSWDHPAYGVVLGSHWMAVDVDTKDGSLGRESLAALEDEHGTLPDTLIVRTASGGFHLLFTIPPDRHIPKSDSKIGKGLDIRGNQGDGYLIGVGSYVDYRDKSGNRIEGVYEIISGDTPPAPAPGWLISLAESKPRSKAEPVTGIARAKSGKTEIRKATETWQRRGEKGKAMSAVMSAVMAGQPYATSGSIRNVTRDLAFWLSGAMPHLDPVWFSEQHLERSWIKMYPRYESGRIERDWLRSWETALEQHASRKNEVLAKQLTLAQSRISHAFGGERSEPYSDAEIETWAQEAGLSVQSFLAERLIVKCGRAHYLFLGGDYEGPFQSDAAEQARDLLSPFGDRVKIDKFNEGTSEFDLRPIGKLIQDYGCTVRQVMPSMTVSRSYVDGRTFVEAVAKMAEVEPAFSTEVEAWLKDLCGNAYPRILDWIATLGDREQAAPAAWFLGGAGTGKSLFAKACAGLWGREQAADIRHAMGRFNGEISRCPLVFGDEKIPMDAKGRPDVEELKTLISRVGFSREQKGLEVDEVRGVLRVILSANNQDMLRLQKNLTPADIDALTDRIIAVDVPADCPRLPRSVAEGWLRERTATKHFAWLMAHHQPEPGDRFACKPYAAALGTRLLAHGPLHSGILEHCARSVLGDKGQSFSLGGEAPPAVRWHDGKLMVSASLLRDEQDKYGAFSSKVSMRDLQTALEALTERSGVPVRVGSSRYRHYVLHMDTLESWVAHSDIDPGVWREAVTEGQTRRADATVN